MASFSLSHLSLSSFCLVVCWKKLYVFKGLGVLSILKRPSFGWNWKKKYLDRTIIIDMPLDRKDTEGGSTRVFCPFSSRRYICCILGTICRCKLLFQRPRGRRRARCRHRDYWWANNPLSCLNHFFGNSHIPPRCKTSCILHLFCPALTSCSRILCHFLILHPVRWTWWYIFLVSEAKKEDWPVSPHNNWLPRRTGLPSTLPPWHSRASRWTAYSYPRW